MDIYDISEGNTKSHAQSKNLSILETTTKIYDNKIACTAPFLNVTASLLNINLKSGGEPMAHVPQQAHRALSIGT